MARKKKRAGKKSSTTKARVVAKKPRAGRKAKGQKVARGRGKYRGK